jgi:outer membrane lipoprotein SlyB
MRAVRWHGMGSSARAERTMNVMRVVILGLAVALWLAGCASSTSGSVYSPRDTRTAWDVDYGRVTDVDIVKIEGEATEYGKIGGGYIGYETGRAIGNNSGHTAEDLGGAVGAVAGALVGSAVEKAVTSHDGYQITVQLDGGRTIAIVQAKDQSFAVGERVKIYSRHDGAARVAKL